MKKNIPTMLAFALVLLLFAPGVSALTIDAIDDKEIHAGETFTFDEIIARNETNDEIDSAELNYYLLKSPEDMEIDEDDGVIEWMPLLKKYGEHTIKINVTNSTNISHYDTTTFKINVLYNDFDISMNLEDAPTEIEARQDYRFELEATEENYPDAIEGFEFTLEEGPSGMTITNNEIRWTPKTDQEGEHTIRVSVLPKDAPSDFESVEDEIEVSVDVPALTIDRVEVRSGSRRLETITRSDYLSGGIPYLIDRDASLGDEIELRVSIRNNLETGTDNEMRDVEIELYSYDLAEADGLDEFISRIRPGRTEDQTIRFYLDATDLHPDDSPFDLEIRIYGETRGGDLYSDVWDLELEVESRSYDLLMTNLDVTPTNVCPNDRFRVTYDLRNIGTRDLSNAGVKYFVSGLGIDEWDRNINIDYDETRSRTKFLTVPEDAIPGEYMLEITSHPRSTSTSDTRTEALIFTVDDCEIEEEIEEEEEEEETVVVEPPEDPIVPGTPVSEREGTPSTSIFDREGTIYVVLLTALVVLLLVGVVLLLIKVLK